MLACCLRSIVVPRPMPFTASAHAFFSSSRRIISDQLTNCTRLHSAYSTRARLSACGAHPPPPASARALSLDAKAGGSTKHRSAILHATLAKGGGAIAGEDKLLYRSPFSLIKHNPINGSGDVKQMVLGISVGVFGIVAARTIGALVKRHIDSVETAGASSLRVRTLKFPWGFDEHTVDRSAFKAAVKGYNPIILGGGGPSLLFVTMNDSTYVMNLKSGVVDVPACEAALNGVDEEQQPPQMLSPNAGDMGSSASPSVK